MAYFQDGTQKYGIPDSPITISAVTYIAEEITVTSPSQNPKIRSPDGSPLGQVVVDDFVNGTAKLQFATYTTAAPTVRQTFTMQGSTWVLTSVGQKYSQGAYAYCDVAFVKVVNP